MQRLSLILAVALPGVLACSPERNGLSRAKLDSAPTISGLKETVLSVDNAQAIGFGASVAATSAGVLVGTPDQVVAGKSSGGVVPFRRVADGWVQEPAIVAPDPTDMQRFGTTLASIDEELAVGGPYPATGSGRVWLFDRAEGAWVAKPNVVLGPPSDAPTEPGFGRALALTARTLVVGSEAYDNGDGMAYVFERAGTGWGSPVALMPDGGVPPNAFYGSSVAAYDDEVVVGAPFAGEAGVVYIFSRSKNWLNPLVVSGAEDVLAPAGAAFGKAVALDGVHLFVGATGADDGKGAVYTWRRGQSGEWIRGPNLVSKAGSTPDGVSADDFGATLGISIGRLFVAAPSADALAGRVEAFSLDQPGGEEARFPTVSDAGVRYFGSSISTTRSTVVVGSQSSVYVYELEPGAPCAANTDCQTGYCVEGVCCDSACDGRCKSCLASQNVQATSGVCGPVRLGRDPHQACPTSRSPCGTVGYCDGEGSCAFTSANTVCSPAECASATETRSAARCDGKGQCLPARVDSCKPGYPCTAGACANACAEDLPCASGYYCLDGACVSGPHCSVDRRIAYDKHGASSPCDDVLCANGVCPSECLQTGDCVVGVCHPTRHTCGESDQASLARLNHDGGCACRIGHPVDDPSRRAWIFYPSLILGALRRVSRTRANPMKTKDNTQ